MTMMIPRRAEKKRMRKRIAALVLAVCIISAGILGVLMWRELTERKEGLEYYDRIASEYFPPSGPDGASAKKDTNPNGTSAKKDIDPDGADAKKDSEADEAGEGQNKDSLPYWLENLRRSCKDAVGWIYLEDSRINYPIVQGEDNEFYLHHLADGTENAAGSIMMDIRCDSGWTDTITILHGHHMKNGSMFGGLEQYKDPGYWEKHKTIQLYTASGKYEADIFAACEVDGNSFSFPTSFETEDDWSAFAEQICAASSFQSDIRVEPEDHLLLLSTCAYSFEDARYIVVGKLSVV